MANLQEIEDVKNSRPCFFLDVYRILLSLSLVQCFPILVLSPHPILHVLDVPVLQQI